MYDVRFVSVPDEGGDGLCVSTTKECVQSSVNLTYMRGCGLEVRGVVSGGEGGGREEGGREGGEYLQ